MKEPIEVVPHHLVSLVEGLRARLRDPQFWSRHRRRPEDFTRERCLTFPVVMLFILQKTVKSIQRHLHEFLGALAETTGGRTATPGAWTQARAKLQASAFVELNTACVLPLVYGPALDPPAQRWHGHRLLGLDGSVVRLPYHPDLAQHFRAVIVHNQLGEVGPRYCEGRISVLYDLLNRVGLDGRLVSSTVGEVSLGAQQVQQMQPGDVAMVDSGFTGYWFLAQIRQQQAHFVARCSPGSFGTAQELFRKNRAGRSVVVRLFAPPDQKAQLRRLGLPLSLLVRFVTVRLATGELEVLVTSLVDPAVYPTAEFSGLYHRRWGQETYYLLLKSRLDLENWSGQTTEAVQQDFQASLLLSNLESLVSQPVQAVLDQHRPRPQNPQQVNRAGAYHALKDQVLELLAGEVPPEEVVRKLQRLFADSPVSVRSKRRVPRRKRSMYRSYHFQRCVRKIVF